MLKRYRYCSKIFNAYWHESVKLLQYYCSCLHVSILVPMTKLLLWKKILFSDNPFLCRLARCRDASIFALAAKYFIVPHEVVRSSVAFLKDCFWLYSISLICVMSFCAILCLIVCFIVHAAFVRIKLMMIAVTSILQY